MNGLRNPNAGFPAVINSSFNRATMLPKKLVENDVDPYTPSTLRSKLHYMCRETSGAGKEPLALTSTTRGVVQSLINAAKFQGFQVWGNGSVLVRRSGEVVGDVARIVGVYFFKGAVL